MYHNWSELEYAYHLSDLKISLFMADSLAKSGLFI